MMHRLILMIHNLCNITRWNNLWHTVCGMGSNWGNGRLLPVCHTLRCCLCGWSTERGCRSQSAARGIGIVALFLLHRFGGRHLPLPAVADWTTTWGVSTTGTGSLQRLGRI